jgi:2-polyprenyl-3-methyl-5-hydroxy-6-metoxy-1,4-benzoquinol methylase
MSEDSIKAEVESYYDAVAKDYHQRYDPGNLLTAKKYSANYFRLQLLIERLSQGGVRRVFEVGVGEGTPLTMLARRGFEVAGCDISTEMVEATRKKFAKLGIPEDNCQLADIEDASSMAGLAAKGPYDAVVAFGVLPHVRDDDAALANMRAMLSDGGRAFIEFRNKLFSLFTFNRHTKSFILDDLLGDVAEEIREAVSQDLERRLALDLPPVVDGYDRIFAKYHNPYALPELFAGAGYGDLAIHWYHFHPAPPLLEEAVGQQAYRKAAMGMEGATADWRGHFLCSAGVVEAAAAEAP